VTTEVAAERRWILTQPEDLWTQEEQRSTLADPLTVVLLAEPNADPADTAGVLTLRRGPRLAARQTADLGVSIRARYRAQGLGRALMQAAESEALAIGIRKICLGVFAENERAMGLYRSLGYIEEGRLWRQFRFADGDRDEVLMAKWIAPYSRAAG
jgi:RimJ/RimL family protein N-acetyltransferase